MQHLSEALDNYNAHHNGVLALARQVADEEERKAAQRDIAYNVEADTRSILRGTDQPTTKG